MECGYKLRPRGMTAGWEPGACGPVLGGALGNCADCHVIREDGIYKMWFTWKTVRCIAYAESRDGIRWEMPRLVLTPRYDSEWEIHEVSQPAVIHKDGIYHMWYTGQVYPTEITAPRCCIGYAVSRDGIHWDKRENPVLVPRAGWEGIAVMYPHVMREGEYFLMWYSAGRITEPHVIGAAKSVDGIHWERILDEPVFTPDQEKYWESARVLSCFVCPKENGFYTMFYVGEDGDGVPGIGIARSRDGMTDWQRNPANPVIAGTDGLWDWRGAGKMSVLRTGSGYRIWYKGIGTRFEEIGIACHKGFDLGFDHTGEDERGVDDGTWKNNLHVRDKLLMGIYAVQD